MQRILVLSSYVAHGAVGLQAAVPPLQRPGRDVIALPTTLLSNHPGHPNCAGDPVSTEKLAAMMAALDANGWLTHIDAILTGYLPTAAHAEWAGKTVERLRSRCPRLIYVCDPGLGDDPGGLYVSATAAETVRDRLMPIADLITPNRFELAWLSGVAVDSSKSAIAAARRLATQNIAATSIPDRKAVLANLFVTPATIWTSTVARVPGVPHGTGDLFAGLLLASLLDDSSEDAALAYAVGGVAHAVSRSINSLDLELAGQRWTADAVAPADVEVWHA